MPRLFLALSALLLSLSPQLHAQGITDETPLRPVTRAFALTNARVVQAPGRVLERATVIVRDGRIEAVGRDATVPYDAEVIEADSLTVYPGFIDALGHIGVAEPPDDENDEDAPDPGDPSRERAGITPDVDVRPLLRPGDGSVERFRAEGFTAAHAVPHGRVLPGQGAVFMLRTPARGERNEAVLLTGPISLFARFEGARGVYPRTPMAVMAVLRDLTTEARRRRGARTRYESGDALVRPRYDPVLDALLPALDGERPVYFGVETTTEAYRVLAARDAFDIPVVLAGLPWSAPLTARLAEEDVTVLAPLALPDTLEADTTVTVVPYPSASPGGTLFITERRTRSYETLDDERGALYAQRAAAIGRYEANAATLAQAEVPFAFTSREAKPTDIRANLRRMVAAGLSQDDALAALTTTPARMLGLDRTLGTIERGKLANLVVTDGDYFDEETAVRFVVVEGVKYEVGEDDAPPEGADPDAVVDATGTWSFSVQTPDGEQTGTFTLTGSGTALRGTVTTDEPHPFTLVELEGNVLTLRFLQPGMGEVRMTGVIQGDALTGSADVGSLGSFSFAATRRPN